MQKTMMEYYKKYKEPLLYLIFGGLTTLVNLLSYLFLTRAVALPELTATALSWFLSVVFAYITNKIWVFESKSVRLKDLIKEICGFFGCRLFSGLLDFGIMYLFVLELQMNDFLIKILSNLLVIVLNYLFSKLWIFKKKTKSMDDRQSNQSEGM